MCTGGVRLVDQVDGLVAQEAVSATERFDSTAAATSAVSEMCMR